MWVLGVVDTGAPWVCILTEDQFRGSGAGRCPGGNWSIGRGAYVADLCFFSRYFVRTWHVGWEHKLDTGQGEGQARSCPRYVLRPVRGTGWKMLWFAVRVESTVTAISGKLSGPGALSSSHVSSVM